MSRVHLWFQYSCICSTTAFSWCGHSFIFLWISCKLIHWFMRGLPKQTPENAPSPTTVAEWVNNHNAGKSVSCADTLRWFTLIIMWTSCQLSHWRVQAVSWGAKKKAEIIERLTAVRMLLLASACLAFSDSARIQSACLLLTVPSLQLIHWLRRKGTITKSKRSNSRRIRRRRANDETT